jgi:hypothetical protein
LKKSDDDARDWERAPVNRRSAWGDRPLDLVAHVAHVDAAVAIVRERKIRAGLVYDESKLRKRRICVTWLSPNAWVDGSMYGHIRFELRWRPLIRGLRAFWVERIAHYHPTAYRFLLSTQDRTRSGLRRYRPARDGGPWIRRGKRHAWNGSICLEVMVERDVPLRSVRRISFVAHHRDLCRASGSACAERRTADFAAGARFLASIVGNEVPCPHRLLRKTEPSVLSAAAFLIERLAVDAVDRPQGIRSTHASAPALSRAAFAAYGRGSGGDARAICRRFRSRDSLVRALRTEFARQRGWAPRLARESL